MGMRWYMFRSDVSSFLERRKNFFRRFYWACITSIAVLIIAIPIGMGLHNPDVRLPDFHGPPPPELVSNFNRLMIQYQREHGRLSDFAVLANRLYESYPYFELVTRENGVDFMELSVAVLEELTGLARYEITPRFFSNFIVDQYLSVLGDFGGLRLSAEPHAMPGWITQPYFFGLYDARFYDDRFNVPVREGNVITETLAEGIMYLRVSTFLPKGYELVSRNPYWYFCFDADKEYLLNLSNNLYGVNDLIIDIRGNGSGFGDYFIPLVLAPFLHETMNTWFYAFHTEDPFPRRVSAAYRAWYGLGEAVIKDILIQGFSNDLPEVLTFGFPIDVTVQPTGDATFEGRVWLLTDSDNFSGPNLAYLQMARDAGFTIVYEENPESVGWASSFIPLTYSGLSVRFNPLYFTDETGQSFEEIGMVYDYRYREFRELLGAALPLVP